MFRSVRLFRLNSPWPESEEALSQQLSAAAFRLCGPFTERSSGWEPPGGDLGGRLCRRVEGADLLRLRSQTRLLPNAAIEDALEMRLEEYRERTQEEPGRREKRRLKELTRDELLPKALPKSQRTCGFVIASERIVAVDTLSDARAEHFIEHLRASLVNLDVVPLAFNRPVDDLLSRIFLGNAPRNFVLGRECRMCDPADAKASIRCADLDLADPAVRRHVSEGMQLTHLGIEFGNVLSCTIDRNGGIGKLKLVGTDVADALPDEDPLARLDAEFALVTGTLRQLITAIETTLGGYDEAAPPRRRIAAVA
jgi:recombination associated protein RdgC